MTGMATDYGALTAAVAELRTAADELSQGRRLLHRSFGDFLGHGWRGRAADSFGPGWDEWSAGFGDILDALRAIADLLVAQGRAVEELDLDVGFDVTHLQARLGRVS